MAAAGKIMQLLLPVWALIVALVSADILEDRVEALERRLNCIEEPGKLLIAQ